MELYIVCEIGLVGLLYARIVRMTWRKAGRYQVVTKLQAGAFAAGLLALLIARVGPVDWLSDRYFSAHMLRSLLLTLAAPALMVAGLPGDALRLAIPPGSQGRWSRLFRVYPNMRKSAYFLVQPAPAWVIHAAALSLWLQPQTYHLNLQSEVIQSVTQVSLFAAGLCFWISFSRLSGMGRSAGPRRLRDALLSVATLGVLVVLLGGLIAFTPQPQSGMIPVLSRLGFQYGLDDRKLAGILLWLLAGGAYLAASWSTVRRSPALEVEPENHPEYVGIEREY